MNKGMESGMVVAIGALTILTTTTLIHSQGRVQSDGVSRWLDSKVKQAETWVSTRTVSALSRNAQLPGGQSTTSASEKKAGGTTQTEQGMTVTEQGITETEAQGTPPSNGSSNANKPGFPAVPTTAPQLQVRSGLTPEPKTTSLLPTRQSAMTNSVQAKLQAQGFTSQDIQTLSGIMTRLVSSMTSSDWTTLQQALAPSVSTMQSKNLLIRLLNTHLNASDKQWLLMHFQGSMAFSQEDVDLLKEAVAELQNDMTPQEQELLQQQAGQLLSTGSPNNGTQ